MKFSFSPIISERSRVLILGTMPSDESLRRQEYYANPNNQFWSILARVYSQSIGDCYPNKIRFLLDNGLALWDVLKGADREGSLDSNIKNEIPNDFGRLFRTCTSLTTVAFNGTNAEKLFRRHVVRKQDIPRLNQLELLSLPSTSPTPGRYVLSFEQKIVKRQIIVCKSSLP